MRLADVVSIDDLRAMARRRMPTMVFDAIEGAAEDEVTMRANRAAFQRVTFRPQPFVDVSNRSQQTTLFGQTISTPVMFSPTGSGRLAAPDADLILARVAARRGTIYVHSTVASYEPEDVAAAGGDKLWFQLYLPADRDAATTLIKQVRDAGYRALLLTVDTAVRGSRERDARNKFSLPYKVSPHLIAQGLSRPRWSAEFVLANFRMRNTARAKARRAMAPKPSPRTLRQVESALIAARWPATWEDLAFVRDLWDGPLLVKGVLRGDECDRFVNHGVDGVVVSNHGGRQLDSAPATLDILPEVVEAAAGRLEVYVDGGIRRGSDVVKALGLGAKACLVGRPYIYALAAGGEAGLDRMVTIFQEEIDRAMALLGCPTIADIDRSVISVEPRR